MTAKPLKTVYYRAAGGIVLDAAGQVLLLERHVRREGRKKFEVRLPKGHIEPGETPEAAAMREVCEESGYCHLRILADLGEAHVAFDFKKKHIERDEHYFLMQLTQPQSQAQQPDHDEERYFVPIWVKSLAQAEAALTYEAEKRFVRRARAWLNDAHQE